MSPDKKKLWFHSATASVVAVLLSLFGYALNHTALDGAVFLLVPFCTGLTVAFMSKGRMVTTITATTSLLLSLTVLVLVGVEGIGCAVMAFPILFGSIGIGALVGYFIGKKYIHRYGNITVPAVCLGLMASVGWMNSEKENPETLIVQTRFEFYAPMEKVWNSVIDSGTIDGDDASLRALGLPVPQRCEMDDDGNRICYFTEGEMRQTVTKSNYGDCFEVDIVKSFEVRPWLAFERAGYAFAEHEEYVEVIRTDEIASRLRPRWYWSWFEAQCVRMEHRYVMSSMKRKAEHAAEGTPATPPITPLAP